MALIFVGLGFKLSIVPFHMWAPDTYEGAPLPVTAYLAIASKTAAFALVLRFLCEGVILAGDLWQQWQIIFAVIAALSMLTGNLVALVQSNMKRLMAYSSIGHIGYILAGITVLSAESAMAVNSVSFYLIGYAVTNMVVFAAIISFFNMTGKDDISDLRGLADTHPLLAASIAIGLFSLAGLPIFAGFTAKFYLFTIVASSGFLWLAGVAIISSLISLYYYLQIVRQMYIEKSDGGIMDPIAVEPGGNAAELSASIAKPSRIIAGVLLVGLLVVVWLGVYPAPLLEIIDIASQALIIGS
jgi:NADH-quinone oxidoreductase subunit N